MTEQVRVGWTIKIRIEFDISLFFLIVYFRILAKHISRSSLTTVRRSVINQSVTLIRQHVKRCSLSMCHTDVLTDIKLEPREM